MKGGEGIGLGTILSTGASLVAVGILLDASFMIIAGIVFSLAPVVVILFERLGKKGDEG